MVSYLYPRSGGVLFHGDTMANPENLKPPFTPEEARENGKKGAIASAKARRAKKDLREAMIALLEGKGKDGRTGAENLAASLFEKALSGDVRACAEIRDTIYGKPVSTIEMTGKDGTPLQPPAITVEFIKDAD